MKKQLIDQVVKNFKTTLNSSSKWFIEDLSNFKKGVSEKSVKELEQMISNFNAMNDENSSFNRSIRSEEKRMLKCGMFNVNNMKPFNCLD